LLPNPPSQGLDSSRLPLSPSDFHHTSPRQPSSIIVLRAPMQGVMATCTELLTPEPSG
jgi:hypothetical protein